MSLAESLPNDQRWVGHIVDEPNRDLPPFPNLALWLSPPADIGSLGGQSARTGEPNRARGNQTENGVLAMAATTPAVKIQYGWLEKGFAGVVVVLLGVLAFVGGGALLDIKELKTGVANLDKGVAVANTKLETVSKSLDEVSKKADKTNDQFNTLIGRLPPTLRP
jgi:hypothetical protein